MADLGAAPANLDLPRVNAPDPVGAGGQAAAEIAAEQKRMAEDSRKTQLSIIKLNAVAEVFKTLADAEKTRHDVLDAIIANLKQ